jgi:hypothetical protein
MIQENNRTYNEDCNITLERGLLYDLILCSPPDFEEIGYNPKDLTKYKAFLLNIFQKFKPSNGYVTIFVSDRKYNGSVIEKHSIVRHLMEEAGFKLVHQKIWVRSYKKNLYRMNYTFILTFHSGIGKKNPVVLPDVFYAEHKAVGEYNDNFNRDIAIEFIKAYTEPYHIVYDPFMGSGTTALACLDCDRRYLGSEIDTKTWQLGENLLETYGALWIDQSTMLGCGNKEPIQTK